MANKERETEGRMLQSTSVGDYVLLNSEKLSRTLDLLEDAVEPATDDEKRIVGACKKLKDKDMRILSLYDRFGGAIKLGERKLVLGTFYDFAAREPREKAVINESDYEDEFVLVRKQTRRNRKVEDVGERMRRLEKANPENKSVVGESEEKGTAESAAPKKKAAKKAAKKVAK